MNYAVCFLPLIRIFVDLVKEMWQAILGKIMNPINILIWLPWCFNVINNNWLLRTLFGCSVLRMTPPCLRFVFVQPFCSSCRLRHDFHYHVPHPDQWSVVQLISSSHRAPIWKKITDLVILSWQSSRQSFNISWAHNVFSSDSWQFFFVFWFYSTTYIFLVEFPPKWYSFWSCHIKGSGGGVSTLQLKIRNTIEW